MDGPARLAISDIEVCDMFKNVGEEFSVGVDDCTVDRTAKVLSVVLFEHGGLSEMQLC